MSSPTTTWPIVTATIEPDGSASVTASGSRREVCPPGDYTVARSAVIGHVAELAGTLGRPVEVTAKEPGGSHRLRIDDSGHVVLVSPVSTPPDARPDPSPSPTAPPIPTPVPVPDRPETPRSMSDLLHTRPATKPRPATWGWRGAIARTGLWKPSPSPAELEHRERIHTVQRTLRGPRTIVLVNPKGGAGKTTDALLLSATLGDYRGGHVLAWDNNENRGTLGLRAEQHQHSNTAVDLLRDLDRFDDRGRFGDLGNYVRGQGDAQFDVLASAESAQSAASIDADGFTQLHTVLSRFYRLIVVDTGNNRLAPNWQAAVHAADQLVFASSIREDSSAGAAWLVDALHAEGLGDKVRQAVTVLSAVDARPDKALTRRLTEHFAANTRAVVQVPYDPALQSGGPIVYDQLSRATRRAWLHVAAVAVADL